jgi:hypothetical protein
MLFPYHPPLSLPPIVLQTSAQIESILKSTFYIAQLQMFIHYFQSQKLSFFKTCRSSSQLKLRRINQPIEF